MEISDTGVSVNRSLFLFQPEVPVPSLVSTGNPQVMFVWTAEGEAIPTDVTVK
jgi:hypothetical protein